METLIGPGLGQSISQQGGRFYYMGGRGEIEVKLKTGGDTRRFTLLPGKGIAMREGERFDGLEIVNLLGEAQQIEFEVSDREVFDNRVTGVVEVVNTDRVRTDSNSSFLISVREDAGAGQYAMVILENPIGSGKVFYVNQVVMTSTDRVDAILGVSSDVREIENSADTVEFRVSDDSQDVSWSKNIGGGASVALMCRVKATVNQFPKYRGLARVFVEEYGNYTYRFTEPVRVDEGCGLCVQSLEVGAQIAGTWEFFEEFKV